MSGRHEHKAEEIAGKAKTAWGKTTGSDELIEEGQEQQDKGRMKQAGDDIKDAARHLTNKD